jgi:hypothetical protein
LIVFSVIFGVGPKTFGVSILDEVGLLIGTCLLIWVGKLGYKNTKLLIAYMYILYVCIHGIINLYTFNTLRYLLIFILIFIFQFININKSKTTKNSILIAAFLYLFVYSLLPIVGSIFGLKVAYWQDNLWSGTAYAAFGCYFSVVSIILLNRIKYVEYFTLYIYIITTILTDSRLMEILILPIIIIFILSKLSNIRNINYRIIESNNVIKLSIMIYVFISIFSISNGNNKLNFSPDTSKSAVVATLKDFISEDNVERDSDRVESNMSVLKLAHLDFNKFIFGGGILTHQLEMKNYLESPSKIVRPTGFPAIIFDGGIIFMIIIVLLGFITIYQIKNIKEIKLYVFIGSISLPFISILILPITNPVDMILFWFCIMPKSFPYIIATAATLPPKTER